MPFNTLMLDCLIHGTSFGESGSRVRVEPKPGETVLFFHMDDPRIRKKLKIDGKICDLLVFYAKGDKKVLCLTELKKGSKSEDANEQAVSTYDSLKKVFKAYFSQIEWKGYIHLHGSAPGTKKSRKKGKQAKQKDSLKQKFKTKISQDPDMGKFLRNQT